ncbi:Multidrug resistance protein MdtC [Bacillus sp. THAF10]|uniref:efflux RND transporter permease subunit n=1 Tax=Bacillus sp. THAF10 TaxID=2587848 RepID=UPI0012681D86|nr:efflux RND transporter permease subunit [Bacillus sp. THAF10]QFT88305.1 Multidrug resistance protein MdtC [Bacillus sp. THAF10]
MFNAVIKKPKVTLIFILLLVFIGSITFFQVPKREIPEISLNVGTITTVYPGASPTVMERDITTPLEKELLDIQGMENVSSVSGAGISNIVLELADDADRDQVFSAVRQAVSDVSRAFPEDAMEPTVNSDIQMGAIASYHILNEDREALLQEKETIESWVSELEKIAGVRKVAIKGFDETQIMLNLNSNDMQDSQITVPDVISAIQNELEITPLGSQQEENRISQLTLEHIENLQDVEKVFIKKDAEGNAVYVGDIAEFEEVPKDKEDIVTYNGTPAISFTIMQKKGVDIPTLHANVDKQMKQLSKDLPEDFSLDLYYTQNEIVSKIFKDLGISFLISIFAVVLITFVGLNAVSAILVALAIPISIALGLIPLPYANVDLNQISIIGIIIALGILVDDAIVVNDNIQRRYQLGDKPLQGALQGTKEVRVSIITSTLAIVFTFLPLTFLGGPNGAFISALPTVLISTIIGSTIVALTVVPIFMAWRQKKRTKKKVKDGLLGTQFNNLSSWYSSKVLTKVIKKPLLTGMSVLVFCTASYGLVPFIPVVFFPSADREEVTVTVTYPAGTPLSETEARLQEMESAIKDDEAVYETTIFAGSGEPGIFGSTLSNSGENTGQIVIRVNKEQQSAEATIKKWQPKLREAFPEAVVMLSTIEAGPPVGAPIALTVVGEDIDEVMNATNGLKEEMERLKESGAIIDDVGPLQPTIKYVPNRELMEEHGITAQEISNSIRLVTEGIPVGSYEAGMERELLTIIQDRMEEEQTVDLRELELPSKTERGEFGAPVLVPLSELVTEEETEVLPLIPHKNGERTVTIRVYPNEEDKQKLETNIKEIAESYNTNSVSVSVGGESSARSDFFVEVGKLFIVVIFLIYILMVVQFNSLRIPLLIMSSVYLAISGAVIGLFLTQTGLGFMAMMGIVSLAGIVVRNATVFIEFMDQRLSEGATLSEAVIDSGNARLRPVVLTAFTSIAALLPIAFSGDVLFTPLAISIISGIFFSTFFTLLFVPAFYVVLKRKKVMNE